MERTPAVYILASQTRGSIYIGVTSNPLGRIWQHREGVLEGFTKRHGIKRLVLIEFFGDMEHAILREKQLKRWHRAWKIALVEEANPTWRDLALDYGFEPLAPAKRPSSHPSPCTRFRVHARRSDRAARMDAETSSA